MFISPDCIYSPSTLSNDHSSYFWGKWKLSGNYDLIFPLPNLLMNFLYLFNTVTPSWDNVFSLSFCENTSYLSGTSFFVSDCFFLHCLSINMLLSQAHSWSSFFRYTQSFKNLIESHDFRIHVYGFIPNDISSLLCTLESGLHIQMHTWCIHFEV